MTNEPLRPTDEQLKEWLDGYDGDSFPPYYMTEHQQYLEGMFMELLAARAIIATMEGFIDGMRNWCSPHDIATEYADRLMVVLKGGKS